MNMPEHPRAGRNGYVKRADLVLEKKLGRALLRNEIAHHKDEDKGNDAEDNLEPMDLADHTRIHHPRTTDPKILKPDHPSNRRYVWPSDSELLRMGEEMTLREIANVIGCNFKTVHERLIRIRGTPTAHGRKHNPKQPTKYVIMTCDGCGTEFKRNKRRSYTKDPHFCNRACAGRRPVPHGTLSGYRHHKCRCAQCKEAHRIHMQGYRKKVSLVQKDRTLRAPTVTLMPPSPKGRATLS